jgi:hypothetical protein
LPKNGNHCFPAPLRDYRELHIASLNVEHRVRFIALRKDGLFIPVDPGGHLGAESLEEICGAKRRNMFVGHR